VEESGGRSCSGKKNAKKLKSVLQYVFFLWYNVASIYENGKGEEK